MQQTTDPNKEPILDAPNTKACEDRFIRIVDALAEGYSLAIAAMKGGIDRDTLRQWLKWGAEGKTQEFTMFLHRCEAARAQFEMSRVDIIKQAGNDGEWPAAAWWLERMIPEVYGKRTVTHHDGRAMPHEWTVQIQGAVDPAGLPERDRPAALPAPEREPIEIAVNDA